MTDVQVTVYGGANQIGGNKILLEDGQAQIFFDFGLNFQDLGKYFTAFLSPRAATSGTYDHLMMGLLPPLPAIYRTDASVEALHSSAWSNARKAEGYRDDVNPLGILVSHAHMDHIGFVSFLLPDTPVVATATTALIAKSMQDTGLGGISAEVVYHNTRQEVDQILRSDSKAQLERRPWLIVDNANWSSAADRFWAESYRAQGTVAGHNAARFTGSIGPFTVCAFDVDHSIPGASAYAAETSEGWVVYTGDFRMHGRRGVFTKNFADKARALAPSTLICEATRAGEPHNKPNSEADVRERALEVVRKETGLVVADFGPRNIERLVSFLEVAEDTGRKLVVLAKDAHLLSAMAGVQSDVPDPQSDSHLWVYKDREGQTRTWKKRVWDRFHNKIIDWQEVARSPGNHILCLSFYDFPRLLDINPTDGSYIYSTAEPYTEEQELDMVKMRAWVDRFNLKFIGDPDSTSDADQGFHASGHASEDEILSLARHISPRKLIPVHTQNPRRIAQLLSNSGISVEVPHSGSTIEVLQS